MNTIAIIMTCHNRKNKTLNCLDALFRQKYIKNNNIKVYLVDDGSTDGTGEAIKNSFPEVIILQGSGNLFWNGGMRLAFKKAMKKNYDYYLWLNDDTLLYEDSLDRLLKTHYKLSEKYTKKTIIVGSTCDPATGILTYGGAIHCSRWHPLKFRLIKPSDIPLEIDAMNGNCVLISSEVVRIVGNIDKAFSHSIGDYDYALRAKSLSCSVWLAPGYVGTCERNKVNLFTMNVNIKEKLKRINQPKGLPFIEWKVFAKRHAGILWPFYCIMPYMKLILPEIIIKFNKNNLTKL